MHNAGQKGAVVSPINRLSTNPIGKDRDMNHKDIETTLTDIECKWNETVQGDLPQNEIFLRQDVYMLVGLIRGLLASALNIDDVRGE